jgi:hypothetical protein
MLEEEVMICLHESNIFSFNSYLSNPVTGEYTKMNQYVNPLKMEMNGDVIYYLNIHILMVQV